MFVWANNHFVEAGPIRKRDCHCLSPGSARRPVEGGTGAGVHEKGVGCPRLVWVRYCCKLANGRCRYKVFLVADFPYTFRWPARKQPRYTVFWTYAALSFLSAVQLLRTRYGGKGTLVLVL